MSTGTGYQSTVAEPVEANRFCAFLRENCPSRKISARVYVKTATVVMANVFPSLRTPQGLYDTCQFIDLVELSSRWIYDTWSLCDLSGVILEV